MRIRSFRQFVEYYKDRWIMPKEFLKPMALKNYSKVIVFILMDLFFGVLSFVLFFAKNRGVSELDIEKLSYYLFYILVGLICLLIWFIIKKTKTESVFFLNLPFYIIYIAGMSLSIINSVVLRSYFSGVMVFVCTALITVTFMYFPPVVFGIGNFAVISHYSVFIYRWYGLNETFDMFILGALLFFLAMHKWRVTKLSYIRNEMLNLRKEALEEEVDKQTEEVRNKSYELELEHKKIINIQNNTIIGLSNLVENRDSDTGEHVHRTSAYVNLLARKAMMNGFYTDIIDEHYIEVITKAAPMHDIGKIVVPDAVLKKPGRLTPEEFEQIKRHTTEGGRIVKEILGSGDDKDYIQMAIDVATSHHERWDGTGYPNNLAGENIPLSARIMAIADVFDALVSPRCYKEPFSVKKAFSILEEEAGTHFDPVLAKLFVGLQEDVVAVMEKYRE